MPQWLTELGGALRDEQTSVLLVLMASIAGAMAREFLKSFRSQAAKEKESPTPLPSSTAAAQVAFAVDRMTVEGLTTAISEVKELLLKVLVRLEREEFEREVDERVQERIDREVVRRMQQEVARGAADYRLKKPGED